EMCYATLACVTDYDCWHAEHATVTVEMIISNLRQNVEHSRQIVREAVGLISPKRTCACGSALKHAIVTPAELVPALVKGDLAPLVGKYMV
ncbi:MAG: S-methyl-5'-thioadenosine phosphorylase, partial [Chloroflexota bacterium]